MQLSRSVPEKATYAAPITLYLMYGSVAIPNGFGLYTDRIDLIFLFDLLSITLAMTQTSLRKVLQWSVRLCMYHYTCYYIQDEENVRGYILSRWYTVPNIMRRLMGVSKFT